MKTSTPSLFNPSILLSEITSHDERVEQLIARRSLIVERSKSVVAGKLKRKTLTFGHELLDRLYPRFEKAMSNPALFETIIAHSLNLLKGFETEDRLTFIAIPYTEFVSVPPRRLGPRKPREHAMTYETTEAERHYFRYVIGVNKGELPVIPDHCFCVTNGRPDGPTNTPPLTFRFKRHVVIYNVSGESNAALAQGDYKVVIQDEETVIESLLLPKEKVGKAIPFGNAYLRGDNVIISGKEAIEEHIQKGDAGQYVQSVFKEIITKLSGT